MEIKFNAGDMCAIPDGCRATIKDGVIIFEKEFKNGDVLHSIHDGLMLIYKESCSSEYFNSHFNTLHNHNNGWDVHSFRYATEEEKQLLFAEMKEQGLRWNAEEKRVEKIRWRAKNKESYYFLNINLMEVSVIETNDSFDKKLWDIFNYFHTKDQAKEAASRVKETLRKYHEETGE